MSCFLWVGVERFNHLVPFCIIFLWGGGGWQTNTFIIYLSLSADSSNCTRNILNCMCVERRVGIWKKIEVFKSLSSTWSPCFVLLYYAKFALLLFYCFLLHDVRFLGTTLTSTSILIHTPANHTLESKHKIAITLCTSLQQRKYGSEAPSSQVKGSDPERIRSP